MANKLAQTDVKLSTSAKFYVSLDNIADTTTLNLGSSSSFKRIGSVESFREENPRSTNPRYEIDSDNPGEILERYPALVERTLTIKKAVLYTSDLLNMFGTANWEDIMDQYKPFTIVKIDTTPGEAKSTGKIPDKATVFTGCWFHTNSKAYDVGSDLKMIQEATIGYVKRFVSTVSA